MRSSTPRPLCDQHAVAKVIETISLRRSTLRLQYASALRRTLVNPLLTEQDAGIPAVIEVGTFEVGRLTVDERKRTFTPTVGSNKAMLPRDPIIHVRSALGKLHQWCRT